MQFILQILKEEKETSEDHKNQEKPLETKEKENIKYKKKSKKPASHDAEFAGKLALIKDQVQSYTAWMTRSIKAEPYKSDVQASEH